MTPEILKVAATFRRELYSLDDSVLRDMARAYSGTVGKLRGQFDAITKQIEEAQAAGKIPVLRAAGSGVPLKANEYSANWLFRQRRYHELMAQLEAEMSRFGVASVDMVARQQERMAILGLDHAQALQQAALPNAASIGYTWNRVPLEAMQNMVGFLGDGSPLAYKFATLAPEVTEAVKSALITGIATGQNPRRIAAALKRESDGGLTNALTVARTETLRAYRAAAGETYRANADVLEGWIWSAGHSPRTCAACWGMDGSFHPLSEDMTDHPAGRCSAVCISKPWSELGFTGVDETRVTGWDPEEHFAKLSEVEQKQVLGAAKFELWQSKKITLRDIPIKQESAVWGDHYRVRALSELPTA